MIGREWAYNKVMANLRRKQNTLVMGSSGIGKSTLLQHIARELGEDRAYYIETPASPTAVLRDAYVEIGGFSPEQAKEIGVKKWNLTRLAKELIKLVEHSEDFVLAIDLLDKVTAASSEWLKALAESQITLLGACRETKDSKPLDRFFWTFEKVVLKPMTDAEIKAIVQQEVYPPAQAPAIQFKDKQTRRYFAERVIKSAKGVPLTAIEMCKRAKGAQEISMTFIRDHLMSGYSASIKYIDATPIILILICFIAAMRYISRGMESQDAYVFFGALSAILLMVRLFVMRSSKRRS